MKKFVFTLAGFATALKSMAHAGHGNDNPLSPDHYMKNPEHAIPITLAFVACIVGIAWASYRLQHRFNKK